MSEVLRANDSYHVELDANLSLEHTPHKSWGIYRVIDIRSGRVVFASPNRDKSFGVFEYLTLEAGKRDS